MNNLDYSSAMDRGNAYIELSLELDEPAELYDLVRSFTALASQFNEYVKEYHPNLVDGDSKIYVKEIRKGSIIASLIPFFPMLIENMDRIIIVDDFIKRYGGRLADYAAGKFDRSASKTDLKDFNGQVAAIANDPNGNVKLASAEFVETNKSKRASFTFDTKEARAIEKTANEHIKLIEAKAYELIQRQLMVFWQSNLKEVEQGRRSAEKVIIEDITKTPLAIVYDSELAQEKIKHEIRDGSRNLYKLGFYISGRVERLNDRPVAYRISEVHEIIDLPDDDT